MRANKKGVACQPVITRSQPRHERIAEILRSTPHLAPEEQARLVAVVEDYYLPALIVTPSPEARGEGTIQERFEAFDSANPWIYDQLVQMARDLVARGKTRVAIGMLWEVLRHRVLMTVDPNSDFKLNDHYRSRYARLIMLREPDLTGVFEIRRLRSP